MPPTSPTVARLEVATLIRERRRALGLPAEAVSKALSVSRVYYSSIENRRATLSLEKLPALSAALEFSAAEAAELRTLLESAHERGWWADYKGVISEEFAEFVGLEHGAAAIQLYESRTITGLLQTQSYAAEVMQATPDVSLADSAKAVELRMRRQDRVKGESPLHVDLIMAEATLLQHYGGPSILREQLASIVRLVESEPDWLDLRIQPFSRTPLGLMSAGTVAILDFGASHLPKIAWYEVADFFEFEHDTAAVSRMELQFDQARRSSLDPSSSIDLVRRHLESIDGADDGTLERRDEV